MARRSDRGADQQARARGETDDYEVLKAKYLDYCSARICDAFMELEEERVFELAQAAEKEAGSGAPPLSLREIAALLFERTMDELSLPDFDTWVASYQANPEKYDAHLLGLWKTRVEPARSS